METKYLRLGVCSAVSTDSLVESPAADLTSRARRPNCRRWSDGRTTCGGAGDCCLSQELTGRNSSARGKRLALGWRTACGGNSGTEGLDAGGNRGDIGCLSWSTRIPHVPVVDVKERVGNSEGDEACCVHVSLEHPDAGKALLLECSTLEPRVRFLNA